MLKEAYNFATASILRTQIALILPMELLIHAEVIHVFSILLHSFVTVGNEKDICVANFMVPSWLAFLREHMHAKGKCLCGKTVKQKALVKIMITK